MIAGQKPEDLAALTEGEADDVIEGPTRSRWSSSPASSTAATRSSRPSPCLLAVSVITNVILLAVRDALAQPGAAKRRNAVAWGVQRKLHLCRKSFVDHDSLTVDKQLGTDPEPHPVLMPHPCRQR